MAPLIRCLYGIESIHVDAADAILLYIRQALLLYTRDMMPRVLRRWRRRY